jgi:hypothetical protein
MRNALFHALLHAIEGLIPVPQRRASISFSRGTKKHSSDGKGRQMTDGPIPNSIPGSRGWKLPRCEIGIGADLQDDVRQQRSTVFQIGQADHFHLRVHVAVGDADQSGGDARAG